MQTYRVLPFGACGLHGPLNEAVKPPARIAFAKLNKGTLVPSVYSFGEIFQLIRMYRGEFDIPADIRRLCDMRPNFEPLPGAASFTEVDVILVEPNVPIDIKFREFHLNRASVIGTFIDPLKKLVPAVAKPANVWFNKGLMAVNDEVRAGAARQIIDLIPDDFADAALAREVFAEAHSSRHEVADGLRRLREMTSLPIGVVTYIYQYLPDGRPVSWPPEFRQQVIDTANKLGLPLFEPVRIVEKHGVHAALKDDLRHYRDEFMPALADAFVDFIAEVGAGRGRAAVAHMLEYQQGA